MTVTPTVRGKEEGAKLAKGRLVTWEWRKEKGETRENLMMNTDFYFTSLNRYFLVYYYAS